MNQILITPILADIGEIIGAVVTLGALVFWVLQKVLEANKEMQGRRKQQVGGARPVANAGAAPNQPAGQQADPLRSQVEEFLRRAGHGEPAKAEPRRVESGDREIELLVDEPPSQPRRREVGAPLKTPPMAKPNPVANIRPERRAVTPRKRKTLAERADERALTREKRLSQTAARLGQRIIAEDEQFDVQLKAKFDHAVGTLAGSTISEKELVPVRPESPAAQIAAMLANPEGVRQAVILNEVLRRPVDQW